MSKNVTQKLIAAHLREGRMERTWEFVQNHLGCCHPAKGVLYLRRETLQRRTTR
jgi:hypothetical protein